MARFYGVERSKIGSTSGTIIAWPVEISSTNPVDDENKRVLPAGYLKCDGARYKASAYPELAEILGVGNDTRFARKDFVGNLIGDIEPEDFVVPDLGSKFIRPVAGTDVGTYNAVNVISQSGVEKRRSGMALEATSTVGQSVDVSYTGAFVIPSQIIPLKGKPSWSRGTNGSGLTDIESVESSQMHPHMHFSTTYRCRIKPTNIGLLGADTPNGSCSYPTASTILLDTWLDATKILNCSTNQRPGANQPPCWAMASREWTQNSYIYDGRKGKPVEQEYEFGTFFGCTGEFTLNNICFSGGDVSELRTSCLLGNRTTEGTGLSYLGYRLGKNCESLGNGQNANYEDIVRKFLTFFGFLPCEDENSPIPIDEGPFTGAASGTQQPGKVIPAYVPGGISVPVDWQNVSLADVVPLNVNPASSSQTSFPQVSNILTEVDELNQADGDPTLHNHKITLNKTDHNYEIKTNAFSLSPDNLKTQVTISTEKSASLDSVTGPYTIIEYLIKI